jgi:hypothetical protein
LDEQKETVNKMKPYNLGSLAKALACLTILFIGAEGCSRPYGLSEVSEAGSGKGVLIEDVPFERLYGATREAFKEAGLKVVNEVQQPELKVVVIQAEDKEGGTVRARIRTLSENSHELVLFTSATENGPDGRTLNSYLFQEIQKRL